VDGDEQVVGPQVDVVPEILITVPQQLMCGQGVDEEIGEHQLVYSFIPKPPGFIRVGIWISSKGEGYIPQYIHLMQCAALHTYSTLTLTVPVAPVGLSVRYEN